jgi:hypothetical protein
MRATDGSRRCVRTSKQDPRVPTDAWGTHRAPAFARLRATRQVEACATPGRYALDPAERRNLVPAMKFNGENKNKAV